MRVIPVESRMMYAVRYDAKKRELEIFFNSGGIYRYQDVDRDIFENLLRAKSKGRFVHEEILGKYRDERVDE